jgi:hypothetical protein
MNILIMLRAFMLNVSRFQGLNLLGGLAPATAVRQIGRISAYQIVLAQPRRRQINAHQVNTGTARNA